jgi:hypothetical protein
LTHEAREKADAEVMSDLLAFRFDESFLCFSAQPQGLPVEHRADAGQRDLFSVRCMVTPRGETPGTTPGYSWPRRYTDRAAGGLAARISPGTHEARLS